MELDQVTLALPHSLGGEGGGERGGEGGGGRVLLEGFSYEFSRKERIGIAGPETRNLKPETLNPKAFPKP